MKTLNLEKNQKANVWLEELPDAAYPSHRSFTEFYQTVHEPYGKTRCAAIELIIPTGARSLYGLLGGQFIPDVGNSIKIEICVSEEKNQSFINTLAGIDEKVYVGLPAEYVEGINSGMKLAKNQLSNLGPGTLLINCSAHGEIGSSRIIFKHLAIILVNLICITNSSPSNEDLLKIFPSVYI
jgi:hypothetical protein